MTTLSALIQSLNNGSHEGGAVCASGMHISTKEEAEKLAKAIAAFNAKAQKNGKPPITSLDVSHSNLPLQAIAAFAEVGKTITALNINGNTTINAPLKSTPADKPDGLPTPPKTGVGTVMLRLAFPNLTRLEMQSCAVDDVGLEKLIGDILGLKHLEHLDVANNHITKASRACIQAWLNKKPGQHIAHSGNPLTMECPETPAPHQGGPRRLARRASTPASHARG